MAAERKVPSSLTDKDVSNLKSVVNEGVALLQQIDDKKEALKGLIEDAAGRLDIDKGILKKVIEKQFKGDFDKDSEAFEAVQFLVSSINGE